MGNNIGLILEKLSFEKIVKPQINLMWKVIFNKYVVDSKKPETKSNRFVFNAKHIYLPDHSDVQDLNSIYYNFQINVVYDFNTAKKLFIKEPYVVFCIDADKAYFDTSREALFDMFFEKLDKSVSLNYMSVVKDAFPTVYKFLIDYKNYDPSNDETVRVTKGEVLDMSRYAEGRELFEKAYEIIKNGLSNKKAVDTHGMVWIDPNLYPMFIWDTEGGIVYACKGLTSNSLLDKRSLRGKFVDSVALDDFVKGAVFDSSYVGFQNPKSFRDWFKL